VSAPATRIRQSPRVFAVRVFRREGCRSRALFDESMTGFSASVDLPIARAADLTGTRSAVDVGGGAGRLLDTILGYLSHHRAGILFDQPHVVNRVCAAHNESVPWTMGGWSLSPGTSSPLFRRR